MGYESSIGNAGMGAGGEGSFPGPGNFCKLWAWQKKKKNEKQTNKKPKNLLKHY